MGWVRAGEGGLWELSLGAHPMPAACTGQWPKGKQRPTCTSLPNCPRPLTGPGSPAWPVPPGSQDLSPARRESPLCSLLAAWPCVPWACCSGHVLPQPSGAIPPCPLAVAFCFSAQIPSPHLLLSIFRLQPGQCHLLEALLPVALSRLGVMPLLCAFQPAALSPAYSYKTPTHIHGGKGHLHLVFC